MAHYSIRVLEIGYDPNFPLGVAFDHWHMTGETGYSPYCMTLIQGEGYNILFDTGIDMRDPDMKKHFEQVDGAANGHNPIEVLAAPDDIDSVIVSHCHWDHICGLSCFENSNIYIQRTEVDQWLRAMADESFPITHKMVVHMSALDRLKELEKSGNVFSLDGDVEELFPSISIRCVFGHSFAQNVLLIDNDDGRYAVIGDVCMRPESFTGTIALPCFLPNLKFAVGTFEDIISSYKLLIEWVENDTNHLIMTHDGTRRDRYPTELSSLGLTICTICL